MIIHAFVNIILIIIAKKGNITMAETKENIGLKIGSVKWITYTAVLMALNVVFSSFSIPVPGGHMYLNDLVIVTAAVLLDPLGAFLAGGIGAFLGDLIFYPLPMFVSLVVHGLQALVIALIIKGLDKAFGDKHEVYWAVIGATVGMLINVAGYSIGRAYIYATPAAAWLKLPYQFLQAIVGSALGIVICYPCKLKKALRKNNLL